jgi:hypothetical protein
MKTTGEVLLAALALAAIYCTVPKNISRTGAAATIRAEQVVLVADGSDPMPLCHKKVCK